MTIHAVAAGKYPYDGKMSVDTTLASLEELKPCQTDWGMDISNQDSNGTKSPKKKKEEREAVRERRNRDYWTPFTLCAGVACASAACGEVQRSIYRFLSKFCEKDLANVNQPKS